MALKQKHITAGGAVFCVALGIASVFIPEHEGNSLKAYADVAGVWTICGGVANVSPDLTLTEKQCKDLTGSTIGKFMVNVAALSPSDIRPQTLAAYTSFAYNIGIGGFERSSTLRLANAGDIRGSCEAMLKWYIAGGKDCRIRQNNCYGVYQRRLDERDLCLKGVP